MIRLALVGNIGSGKTFISKKFGFPVFNADLEVNNLYKNNKTCFRKLNNIFPKFINSFPVKKEILTKIILQNDLNLKKIIKIVHPLIRKKMKKFLLKNKSKKIVVLDVPLFLENRMNKKDDIIIFIESKKSKIFKRLKKRKNYSSKLINKFKKIQLPVEIKKRKSKFTVRNNFSNKFYKKDINFILEKIL